MEFTTIHKSLNLSGFESEVKGDTINYTSPSLQKSVLAETFGYNGSINVRVLGSEIIAGLNKIIVFSDKEEKKYQAIMDKCLKEVKEKPTACAGRYITKGLDAFIPNIPKCFDYKVIETSMQEARAKSHDYSYEDNPMNKYNNAARAYIECCVEKIYATAMSKGVSESQYYYLNVQQATRVGIGSGSDNIQKAVISDFLIKGKEMPVGTVSNGRKKMPDGSWRPVSEGASKKKDESKKDKLDNKPKDKDNSQASIDAFAKIFKVKSGTTWEDVIENIEALDDGDVWDGLTQSDIEEHLESAKASEKDIDYVMDLRSVQSLEQG